MTSIEITLLIIILILIVVLINQDNFTSIFISQLTKNKAKTNILLELFEKIYVIFKKARRFSFVYFFRNKFYKFYLIIAISVVLTKIIMHYNTNATYSLPLGAGKFIDFLIVSSTWEIVCIVTKIIDEKISKK